MHIHLSNLDRVKNVYSGFGSNSIIKKQCDKIIIGYGGIFDFYEIPSKEIMTELEYAVVGVNTPHSFSGAFDAIILKQYHRALKLYTDACPPQHPIHSINLDESYIHCVYVSSGHIHTIHADLFSILLFDLCLYRSGVVVVKK